VPITAKHAQSEVRYRNDQIRFWALSAFVSVVSWCWQILLDCNWCSGATHSLKKILFTWIIYTPFSGLQF